MAVVHESVETLTRAPLGSGVGLYLITQPGTSVSELLWKIRNARPVDALRLAQLAEQTFRQSYEELDVDAYCTGAFGTPIQLRELSDNNYRTIIVESAGVMIGYAQLVMSQVPSCVDDRTAIELRRIYVGKAWHGRGVGRDLLAEVFREATSLQRRTIWLCVWESNSRAIGFYRKSGFSAVGEQAFTLGEKSLRDIIMAAQSPATGYFP